MATLQKIRSKGPLLVIVIGLALFAFIAGDAWKVLQPHQGKQEVGEINGKSISAQDFQKMVDEYSEVIKMTQGVNSLNDDQLSQIKDQVWQTYVNNELISKEAEKLGLKVSDAEIQYIINQGTHPLLMQTPFRNPQTGAFDKDMLKKFLIDYANLDASKMQPQYVEYYQKLGAFWNFIEKTLRESLLAQKYQGLISNSIISNPIQADDNFKSRTEQADVLLAAIPYSSISDSTISVSDSEIKDRYNEKKEMFKQYTETRSIKYVDFQVLPSDKDRKDLLDEITEYATQINTATDMSNFVRSTNSTVPFSAVAVKKATLPSDIAARVDSVALNQVYGPYLNQADNTYNLFKVIAKESLPDSIQMRQIQVAVENEEKTKVVSDSIMNALKANGNFEEIAKKYGQTGESIWVSSDSYEGASLDAENAKFLKSVLNANVNEYNNIKVGQANIIVQVLNKKAFQPKYQVAVVKRPIEFSKDTYNKAYNNFSHFVAQNTTVDKLSKNAEENGYKLLERNDLSSAEHYVGGVKNTKEAMKWIFSAKEGEISPLYECGESDHLMVVTLTKINPEGYRDLALVSDMLKSEIIKDKKAEKITNDIKGMDFDKVKTLPSAVNDTVKHITFSAPAYVAVTRASEPVLGAYTSKTQVNKSTAPIKGNAGVYVLKVYNKEKSAEKFDSKSEQTSINAMAQRYASNFINDLYKKAEVKDKRYLFF